MKTKKMCSMINEQINAEYYSAYLYLAMSLDADHKGLKGFANWYFVQWQEEQDHARLLELYLLSTDQPVELMPIAEVPQTWKSIKQMVKDTLQHEQQVTASINRLVQQAVEDNDYTSISRLKWFVDEQIEEEESVRNILSSLELFGDEGQTLYHLDELLGQRKYKPI